MAPMSHFTTRHFHSKIQMRTRALILSRIATIPTFFLVLASVISSSDAQIGFHRQSSFGGTISGFIVAGLFVIFLICLCSIMMRRRRARATGAPQSNLFGGKPLFGGPWGRSNGGAGYWGNNNNMAPYGNQPSNYNNFNTGAPPQGQQNTYNPEYPPSNAPLPPPAYQNDGNNYTAPPGPPPPAHTKGGSNSFAGGYTA